MNNVAEQMSQLGLEVYSQNFSARRPVTMESEVRDWDVGSVSVVEGVAVIEGRISGGGCGCAMANFEHLRLACCLPFSCHSVKSEGFSYFESVLN